MQVHESAEPIDLKPVIAEALERRRARATRIGRWEYLRFLNKHRELSEGTAVFGEAVILGYAKIGRILQLRTGLRTQFDAPFWVEEKIDGYNVRIFRQEDELLALTRRGYLCPFTTDRLRDFIDERVFEDHPDLVLCAEVAGPDNPYNEGHPPFIADDIRIYVFDLMRWNRPGCFPYRDKLRLLDAYGLPAVPRFGRFTADDVGPLRELILDLDRQGREGIVLKEDSSRNRRVKYVTGSTNVTDIRSNRDGVRQLPPEYFMHRVLRLALFLEEHGLTATPELHEELGESLVGGILEALQQYREQGRVYHSFRCRFRDKGNARLLMAAMRRRLGKAQVRQRRLERQGDFYVLEFDKVLPRTSDLFSHLLGGGLVFD